MDIRPTLVKKEIQAAPEWHYNAALCRKLSTILLQVILEECVMKRSELWLRKADSSRQNRDAEEFLAPLE